MEGESASENHNIWDQLMRFWYLSHCQATKAQACLHIQRWATMPKPLLLAYTQSMEVDERAAKKPLGSLDSLESCLKCDWANAYYSCACRNVHLDSHLT